jgi:hypothetical protein
VLEHVWRNMEPAPVVQGQAEYDGEDHEASAECERFAPAHAPPGTAAAPRTMQPTAIEADRGKKQHTNGDLPAAVGRHRRFAPVRQGRSDGRQRQESARDERSTGRRLAERIAMTAIQPSMSVSRLFTAPPSAFGLEAPTGSAGQKELWI